MIKEFLEMLKTIVLFLACIGTVIFVIFLCVKGDWWAIPAGIVLVAFFGTLMMKV